MTRHNASTITDTQLDALYAEVERGRKAEAHLMHFTAEAHRRKWSYDQGLDGDGIPIPSPAFGALHQLGDDMNAALHKLHADHKAAPAATETAGHRYLSTGCLHGEHGYCSNVDGIAGLKRPAQCKFCTAPCICPCHTTEKEN